MKTFRRIISAALTLIMLCPMLCAFSVNAASGLPFTDVIAGAWYEAAIKYCYENNYVSGTTATTFAPAGNLTRAQFVTLLANIAGADTSLYANADSGFDDVKTSHWYHNAVTWASHKGYVAGTSEDKFSPNANITREQLARIFYVYAEKNGYDVTHRADLSKFSDASKVSSWAKEQVRWAVARGIINGMTATTIAPRGNATRAQAAQIIMTFTKIDFSQNLNRFRAFTSKLGPYIPYDGGKYGLYGVFYYGAELENSTRNDGTYDYETKAGLEFAYFAESDVLLFKYTKEEMCKTPGESNGDRQTVSFGGAVYQGKTEGSLEFRDMDYNSYSTSGSISNGSYVYNIDKANGFDNSAVKKSADVLSQEIMGLFDTHSKKICGYRFASVINAAPKYASLDGMTAYNKLIYSLPLEFDVDYDITNQDLIREVFYKDEYVNYVSDKEYVSVKYTMDNEALDIRYSDDYRDSNQSPSAYESIDFDVDPFKDGDSVAWIFYDTSDGKAYTAKGYIDKNNNYVCEIRSCEGMTEVQAAAHASSFASTAISHINTELKTLCGITLAEF